MDWYQVGVIALSVLLREFAITLRNMWAAWRKTKRAELQAKIKEAVEQHVQEIKTDAS